MRKKWLPCLYGAPCIGSFIIIMAALVLSMGSFCHPTPSQTPTEDDRRALVSMLSSFPAQACIVVNTARPMILEKAGKRIHEAAILYDWPAEKEREVILETHALDVRLREIVSPGWVGADGQTSKGFCRAYTEALALALQADPIWERVYDRSVIKLLMRLHDTLDILLQVTAAMGILDFYDWLDAQSEDEAGTKLRTWLQTTSALLQGTYQIPSTKALP